MPDERTELRDLIAAEIADLTYAGRQLPPGHAQAVADVVLRVLADRPDLTRTAARE
jgi:hypothetical protein